MQIFFNSSKWTRQKKWSRTLERKKKGWQCAWLDSFFSTSINSKQYFPLGSFPSWFHQKFLFHILEKAHHKVFVVHSKFKILQIDDSMKWSRFANVQGNILSSRIDDMETGRIKNISDIRTSIWCIAVEDLIVLSFIIPTHNQFKN